MYGVEPTKVLAVGNDQKFIVNISNLLSGQHRIRLVGGAQGRIEAAERLVLLKPDVVVVDINLDYELGGIDTAFALRRILESSSFVLISPFSDAERLSMVPQGLGLEWSYLLSEGGIDPFELVAAISSAAWSIPYIDRRIDRSRLGALQASIDEAVAVALKQPDRRLRGRNQSRLTPPDPGKWKGEVQTFRLPEGERGSEA